MKHRLLRYMTLIVLCTLWSQSANAVLISSSIGEYDITSQVDIELVNAQLQPWWGSQTLADEFAGLVQDMLGSSVNSIVFPDLGPAFLFQEDMATHWEEPLNFLATVEGPYLETSPIVYAVAAPAAVPSPATGILFLVGLFALGLSVMNKLEETRVDNS